MENTSNNKKLEGFDNNGDANNINSENKADTPPEINFDDFRTPLKNLFRKPID